jgi:hypothetical protein
MEPSDADFIRQLIAETEALPRAKMPGGMSLLANHPGVLSYETKTPEQYDADVRRKHFLEKVSEKYPNASYLPSDIGGPLTDYRQGNLGDLGSPYQYNGMFSGRSPIGKGMAALGSVAAIPINASRMLAHNIDPAQNRFPDASKNLAVAANTLSMYGLEDAGVVPKGTGTIENEYDAEAEARAKVPWAVLDRRKPDAALREVAEGNIARTLPTPSEHLMEAGVPWWAALPWGGSMDMIMDPYPGFIGAARAARAGLPAGAMLAKEAAIGMGPGTAIPTAYGAVEGYNALRDLINPEFGDGRQANR